MVVSKVIKIRSYWLMVFLKCSFFACLSRFAYQIPCGPFELAVRQFYRSILWSSITRTPALIESGIITRDIVPPCLFKMLTGNISQVYSALLNTSVRCSPPARGLFFRFLFIILLNLTPTPIGLRRATSTVKLLFPTNLVPGMARLIICPTLRDARFSMKHPLRLISLMNPCKYFFPILKITLFAIYFLGCFLRSFI